MICKIIQSSGYIFHATNHMQQIYNTTHHEEVVTPMHHQNYLFHILLSVLIQLNWYWRAIPCNHYQRNNLCWAMIVG